MVETGSIAEQPDGAVDQVRAGLHAMWAAVADGWAEHADYADASAAEVTQAMLELARPRLGERVLELACGPGGAGPAAAELVAPDGEVVLSDVAAEIAEIAAARADARGLRNVRTAVLDLESIDQRDGSYDVVLCREGLMFATDPARAARELRRVLRPPRRAGRDRRLGAERNPWLGVVLDTASAQLGAPVPPPGVPGPFSLDDADELAALLSGAELSEVSVRELAVPLEARSFDEWWARTCALAGPLSKLESLSEEAAEALRTRAREAAAPYETADGLRLHGVTLLAGAQA